MIDLDWTLLRAFHATAAEGSLSAAARRLGLTQPTLSRPVAARERQLGVALFDRIGKRLVLTAIGQALVAHVRAMDEAAATAALAAAGMAQAPAGRVSISVTDGYAAYLMPEVLARLRAEVPQVSIVLVVTNRLSDLHHREADIALRHQPPAQPGLVGQHLGDSRAEFYASEAWVAARGMPRSPAELARAGLIGFDEDDQLAGYLRGIGIPVADGAFPVVADSAAAVWEMVRRGLGPGVMLAEIAARTPGVVRLEAEVAPIVVPLWLVTHRELHMAPRIRRVREILAEAFGAMLAR
jgi:DNA-binding transcriptional LysR family regulator